MKTPTQNFPASGRPAVAVSSVSASAKPRQAAEGGSRKLNGKSLNKAGAGRSQSRLEKWAGKRCSAKLLRSHDEKLANRISACGYTAHDDVTLSSVKHADGSVSARWSGLVTCKSVYSCPCCAERIGAERRAELDALLSWARRENYIPLMLTLTFSHGRSDPIARNVDDLKKALTRMRSSRSYRALGLVGSVVATECTFGANGSHPHEHIILILPRGSEADAVAAVEGLRSEWSRCLSKVGRKCNARGFQVQSAAQTGDYIAKGFAAASELALSSKKQGRNGSRSPWQVLAEARDGCAKSAALWVEYSLAFKGRRMLVWSPGLKALAGVDDAVKAQAEAEAAQRSEPVPVRSWPGSSPEWKSARLRRCALSDAVEAGSCLNSAEYGATDAERWREALAGSLVIDDDPGEVPFSAGRGAPAALQAGAV